ncbi:unnamed protein product [Linum tenue]|uniref:Uncharacterized protein n=1 Tax=Linum tenue TaxID=586396 RepID=A0AAV0JRR3_9ROSI|nr:unnamed protein product [Linum tenue]
MGPNAKARWKRYHKIDKGRKPRRQYGVLYPQPPRRKKLEGSKPPVDPVDSDAYSVHQVLNAPKRKPTNKAPKKKEEESEEEESADEKSRTEEEAQSGGEEGHAAEAIYVNPPRPPNPPMASESKRGYSRIRKWRLKKARQQAEDDKATDEKKEKMSYGSPYCQRCREVDELTLVPVADDAMYLSLDDDFGGDDNLKLRVIRYRRKKWLTGGFDADCHPSYLTFGGIFQPYHYRFVVGFDRMVHGSVKYAINEYNRLKEFFFLLKLVC